MHNLRRAVPFAAAALAAALLSVARAPAPALAEEGVAETWDRIVIGGAPSGVAHTVVRRVAGETPRVETTSTSKIEINRMGQTLTIESSSETWETPEGALLRIDSLSKQSAQETRSVFTFAGGKVKSETTVMGNTRTTESEVPQDLMGPAMAEARSRALFGTDGETFEYTSFSGDFQAAVVTKLTSKGSETVTLADGSKAELTRVETTMTVVGGGAIPMKPVAWIDAEGAPRKTSVAVAGMVIETYRVADEASARSAPASGEPTAQPDLFEQTLIVEDTPIPASRRVEEAWITLQPRTADAVLPDVADAGHTVEKRPDGTAVVHSVRLVPPEDRQGTRPLADTPAELADSLAASSMIQSDAPEIAEIAKKVVGDGTNAWKAAQALERWVYEGIGKKSMGVAFASALEVCRSREGDCTEHAVLLAALCRAAGIPARVLMGVEYVYGIWGGHAWSEVWIDGTWYPLDATNGLGFVDPLHLPFARMNFKEGASSEMVQLLGSLGSLDVDATAVVRGGRRVEIDDPALVTTADGVYANRALGISFRTPGGWELDPPGPRKSMDPKVMEVDGKTAEGKKAEIEILLLDAPADSGWDAVLRELRIPAAEAGAGKVDDRESRTFRRARRAMVVVPDDDVLWLFTLDRADDEGTVKSFEAFLATVDLDVE